MICNLAFFLLLQEFLSENKGIARMYLYSLMFVTVCISNNWRNYPHIMEEFLTLEKEKNTRIAKSHRYNEVEMKSVIFHRSAKYSSNPSLHKLLISFHISAVSKNLYVFSGKKTFPFKSMKTYQKRTRPVS